MSPRDPDPLRPYAQALADYYLAGHTAEPLIVHSSLGEWQELPVEVFFRGEAEFFPFDGAAVELCRGRVLDAGAGTGVHALALQERGLEVRAIDVLPEAVQIMRERGVLDAAVGDLFEPGDARFDTILMLMNGIGPVGTLAGLARFFGAARRTLSDDGQILVDSGQAMSAELPAGAPKWDWPAPTPDAYEGEAWIRLEYGGETGAPFRELYLDADTLAERATRHGWRCELAFVDDSGSYLARLRADG